jgi:predicted Zn-dependent protease
MRRMLALALPLALAACSQPPPAPTAAKAETPSRDLVAEVRAVGAEDPDTLDVQPLRDPAVEDLRAAAARHERARDYDAADAALLQALKIIPEDPELLQLRAEIALRRAQYPQAEQLAQASWQRGPRLGGLCRRNWATIRLAREMLSNPAAAAAATQQAARCTLEPPVRM